MSRRTEIPPVDEYLSPEAATGIPALPISRVKKAVRADSSIHSINKSASFMVTVATEMFIEYLAEQSYKAMQADKKTRKTIKYEDVATAVNRIDRLEFASDVVPMRRAGAVAGRERDTKTPRSKAGRKKGEGEGKEGKRLRQTTLDGEILGKRKDEDELADAEEADDEDEDEGPKSGKAREPTPVAEEKGKGKEKETIADVNMS